MELKDMSIEEYNQFAMDEAKSVSIGEDGKLIIETNEAEFEKLKARALSLFDSCFNGMINEKIMNGWKQYREDIRTIIIKAVFYQIEDWLANQTMVASAEMSTSAAGFNYAPKQARTKKDMVNVDAWNELKKIGMVSTITGTDRIY